MRKFRQAHSPPLLFRGAGMISLTTGSRRAAFNAAPVLCTITVWPGCSPSLTGCSVLAQTTSSPGDKKEKGMIHLAGETPEHQPTPVGSGLPAQAPLAAQPSPSCLPSCPTLTARGALSTQKEGIRHCTERADLGIKRHGWEDLLRQMLKWWSRSYSASQLLLQHISH